MSVKQINTYARNLFDNSTISYQEITAFATDHLERMVNNNTSGDLTARIAATSTVIVAFLDKETDDLVQLGARKGVKMAKDSFRTNLADAIRPIAGMLMAKYNDPSPELTACFPQGRSVFGSAADDQLQTHLNTLVTAITPLQAEVGVDTVADATALRDNWLLLYAASEAGTGGKTFTEEERRKARADLNIELHKTIGTLMILYPGDASKFDLYMRQDLLENAPTGGDPDPDPNPGSSSSSFSDSSSSFFPPSSSSFFNSSSSSMSSFSSFFSSSSSGP